MKEFEEKLREYMLINHIDGEQRIFENTCHTVADAASAANASPGDFVKCICMIGADDTLIAAVVKGDDRASTSRVAKALDIGVPRTATPEEIRGRTGYLCGGVPAFGYPAIFLMDPRVMEAEFVYTGGGSPRSLTRIATGELHRANGGQIVRVRK